MKLIPPPLSAQRDLTHDLCWPLTSRSVRGRTRRTSRSEGRWPLRCIRGAGAADGAASAERPGLYWILKVELTVSNRKSARSRLYHRRFLQPKAHFAAFFKIYMFIPTPILIFAIFPILCTVFREKSRIFSIFCESFSFFAKFEWILIGISQKCRDLEEIDTKNAVKKMRHFCETLPKWFSEIEEKFNNSIQFNRNSIVLSSS